MKGVIILSPPWPRSGTSNVVAAQIGAHRDSDEQVYLLLEPLGPGSSKYATDRWQRTTSGMPFQGRIAIDYPRASRRLFSRKFLSRFFGCSDAITEIANYAASGALPDSLLSFIDEHDIELIRVNHVFGMKLGVKLKRMIERKAGRTVSLILDTHDVQSDRRRRNIVSGEIERKETRLAGEIALAKQADLLIHISPKDFDFFSAALPDSRHRLVAPTLSPEIETELVAGREKSGGHEFDFVFFGSHHPGNFASIKWLLAEVLPRLGTHHLNIRIAGAINAPFQEKEPDLFQRYGSLFTGELASTIPFYRSAKAILAHSTAGTGASIKLIEALCAGKITLTNTIGMRGVSPSMRGSDDLLVIDDPEKFAAAMIAVAAGERRYSAQNAAIYDEHFSNWAYKNALRAVGVSSSN